MAKIRAVIFDMFNTLVEDGDSYWMSTFDHIVYDQGLNISGEDLRNEWIVFDEEYRSVRGKEESPFYTYNQAWIASFSKVFEELGLDGDANSSITTIVDDMTQRPMFADTLSCLKQLTPIYRTAVLSNADDRFLYPVVDRIEVEFEEIMSSEKARCYKPGPKIFWDMIDRLQIFPDECLYVGDRQFEDVQGPKEIGMLTAWINRSQIPMDLTLIPPDHTIKNLLQIIDLLA